MTDVIPLQNSAIGLELFMPGYAAFLCDFSRIDEKKLSSEMQLFEVEIIAIRPASDDELAHGHPHGPDGHSHGHDH